MEFCVRILDTMVWNMGENVIMNLKQEIRNGSDKIKLWEETAVNTCQHLTKIVKRYINILDKQEMVHSGCIQDDQEQSSSQKLTTQSLHTKEQTLTVESDTDSIDQQNKNSQIIVLLIDKGFMVLFKFLEINLNDLNKESMKSMRDLFTIKPAATLQNQQTFSHTLVYLQSFFQTVPPLVKNVKSIFQQLQPEILGFIDDIIQTKFSLPFKQNINILQEDLKVYDSHLSNIFELLYLIIMYPRQVHEEHDLQVNKIFPDEKLYIEIIQKCLPRLHEEAQIEEEFINLIRKIINLPLNSILIDNIQKKIIPIMISQIKNEVNFEKQYIHQYVVSIQSSILTKNNLKYMELTQQNNFNSKNKPIWMTSTESFQELALFLTQKEPQFIQKMYQILCEYFIHNKYDISNLIRYYNSDMLKEYFECERILLDLIITKFLPLPSISKQNLRLFGYVLYQNSQFKIDNDQSNSQYNLDDLGINFSKNCLNLLFKAASSDQSQPDYEKAVLFLPYLLNRCRLTLEQFLQEQKYIVGSVSYKAQLLYIYLTYQLNKSPLKQK